MPLKTYFFSQFFDSWYGKWGVALLFPVLCFSLLGPWMCGYSFDTVDLINHNMPPSWQHWFGTDDLGRDLFTRSCYGTRISLIVGLMAAVIDLCIGVLWGGFSGICGGITDEILMRIADIFYSLPHLLIAILISVFLAPGILSLLIAICAIGWINMARIIRGQIILIKEMDYVLAARCLGSKTSHLLFYHMLPNSLGPLIVTLTMTVPSAIFAEAFLSFLGLGIQAPQASLGFMAYEGYSSMEYYPWRLFYPAILLSITILSTHLIAEGVKKSFQPSSV